MKFDFSPATCASHPVTSAAGPARMAYIVSASHSGSTLLAMLLGAQEGVCTVGEIRAPSIGDTDIYQCSCGQRIKECQFWSRVSQAMAAKGISNFDITDARTSIYEVPDAYARRLLNPLFRGSLLEGFRGLALTLSSPWRGYLGQVEARNAALVQVLLELTQAQVVIDSSKAVLHLKYLMQIPVLQIKVIRLIRDGRAVSLSILSREAPRASRAETVAAAARSWRRSNEAAECLLGRLPKSQWIQIQYEYLCRQPEGVLRRICEFLELDNDSITLDFRAREQHVVGNDMRLKSGSEIRLDERWRKQLSAEDLAIFDRVGGEMNRRYGYEG